LRLGTYFLFETAFAAVTLALVGVIVLRKMRLGAFFIYSIVYFVLIWNLPAAWIWNPSGWLTKIGMVDFAGGLVVHGAAAAAGVGIMYALWRGERRAGLATSPKVATEINPGWLTLGILLLWVGWFGFNPGSVLAFNDEAIVVPGRGDRHAVDHGDRLPADKAEFRNPLRRQRYLDGTDRQHAAGRVRESRQRHHPRRAGRTSRCHG